MLAKPLPMNPGTRLSMNATGRSMVQPVLVVADCSFNDSSMRCLLAKCSIFVGLLSLFSSPPLSTELNTMCFTPFLIASAIIGSACASSAPAFPGAVTKKRPSIDRFARKIAPADLVSPCTMITLGFEARDFAFAEFGSRVRARIWPGHEFARSASMTALLGCLH